MECRVDLRQFLPTSLRSVRRKGSVFSSYRSLEEVLEKYSFRSNSITSIPQFAPGKLCICQPFRYEYQLTYSEFIEPHPIDEDSKEFKLCIDDILRRTSRR